MEAKIGDRLHVHSNTVGARDKIGQILEIRGSEGRPPYLVRFPDGHESLVFPGPDCVVEPGAGEQSGGGSRRTADA
ncbi:MAG TPA: DUF1918 domain-containing protein [Asanoa sp.]|jgi:hypothetical protein